MIGISLMTNKLTAENLCCERNDHILFEQLDFTVQSGEVLQIKGLNGSGKSSLLRLLCGLAPATIGNIYWNGKPIQTCRENFLQQLIYIGHQLGLKGGLTPRENCQQAVAMANKSQRVSIDFALEAVVLASHSNSLTENLSAGQKRRVALARLLLYPAALWVLDEPFTALDSDGVRLIIELLTNHVQQGGLAIITSHQAITFDFPIREVVL